MAKITVAKLFETVAEVDKRSQVALMQSEDSIQISEKTRTDLERLIATLRTDSVSYTHLTLPTICSV